MIIKIRVSKATSEDAAYARTNDRVNSIEAKNTEQDSIIEGNTADIESLKSFKQKVESIIDVDCKDTLTLNIGEDKIQLIFNADGSVSWHSKLINHSTISSTSIPKGSKIIMTGKASGGKKPYQFALKVKHSTASGYTWIKGYGAESTIEWEPYKTGTYTVNMSVKDSDGEIVENYIDITVTAAEGDEPFDEPGTEEVKINGK